MNMRRMMIAAVVSVMMVGGTAGILATTWGSTKNSGVLYADSSLASAQPKEDSTSQVAPPHSAHTEHTGASGEKGKTSTVAATDNSSGTSQDIAASHTAQDVAGVQPNALGQASQTSTQTAPGASHNTQTHTSEHSQTMHVITQTQSQASAVTKIDGDKLVEEILKQQEDAVAPGANWTNGSISEAQQEEDLQKALDQASKQVDDQLLEEERQWLKTHLGVPDSLLPTTITSTSEGAVNIELPSGNVYVNGKLIRPVFEKTISGSGYTITYAILEDGTVAVQWQGDVPNTLIPPWM